jgi:hypothetical protein
VAITLVPLSRVPVDPWIVFIMWMLLAENRKLKSVKYRIIFALFERCYQLAVVRVLFFCLYLKALLVYGAP